jgi:hypothetical protein
VTAIVSPSFDGCSCNAMVWKDACSSLLPLKGVKNSHPLQVADCAVFQVTESIVGNSAFAGWLRSCLEQCHRIKELDIPRIGYS